MRYRNATDIFPDELLKEIQKYSAGVLQSTLLQQETLHLYVIRQFMLVTFRRRSERALVNFLRSLNSSMYMKAIRLMQVRRALLIHLHSVLLTEALRVKK